MAPDWPGRGGVTHGVSLSQAQRSAPPRDASSRRSKRWFIYPVPHRPGLFDRLVDELPLSVFWRAAAARVVRVIEPTAALYLRARFSERPLARDGGELLCVDEVWIPRADEVECEAMLRESCPSRVEWSDLLVVEFDDDDQRRRFESAYLAICEVKLERDRNVSVGASRSSEAQEVR